MNGYLSDYKGWLYYFLAVWPWASYVNPQGLTFCTMEIVSYSWGGGIHSSCYLFKSLRTLLGPWKEEVELEELLSFSKKATLTAFVELEHSYSFTSSDSRNSLWTHFFLSFKLTMIWSTGLNTGLSFTNWEKTSAKMNAQWNAAWGQHRACAVAGRPAQVDWGMGQEPVLSGKSYRGGWGRGTGRVGRAWWDRLRIWSLILRTAASNWNILNSGLASSESYFRKASQAALERTYLRKARLGGSYLGQTLVAREAGFQKLGFRGCRLWHVIGCGAEEGGVQDDSSVLVLVSWVLLTEAVQQEE